MASGRPLLGLVPFVAGCGRIGFDPLDGASADAPRIDPLTPFGTPIPLTDLNTAFEEDDVSFTADMLDVFFMSDRTGTARPYRATRSSLTAAWSASVVMPELDAAGSVNNMKATPDGLAIYFASGRAPNAGGGDLWFATRADRSSAFSAPTRVNELATSVTDFEPYVADDRLTIYYSTASSDGGDIWMARRASTAAPFGAGSVVPSLTSGQYEGGPWFDETELVVVFHRIFIAREDLFTATRATTTAPFTVTKMTELSTPDYGESDPWMSPDLRTIVFVSTQSGDSDLYIATR